MKKRTWLRLGLVALAALAVFAAYLWLTAPSDRINRASFEQISEGMTQAEVEAILRVPPGKYCSSSAMIEMKLLDGSYSGMPVEELLEAIREGEAELKGDLRHVSWIGDNGVISISFDHRDRVLQMDFGNMYKQSIAVRFRNWLASIF